MGDDVNTALALEAEKKGVALAELAVHDYVHAMVELIDDLWSMVLNDSWWLMQHERGLV